jgi:hypothetical protein
MSARRVRRAPFGKDCLIASPMHPSLVSWIDRPFHLQLCTYYQGANALILQHECIDEFVRKRSKRKKKKKKQDRKRQKRKLTELGLEPRTT